MSQFLSDSEKTILALKSQGLNFSQISKKVNLTPARVAVKFRKAVKKHFLIIPYGVKPSPSGLGYKPIVINPTPWYSRCIALGMYGVGIQSLEALGFIRGSIHQ